MSKDKDFDNWWNDDILDKSSIHPEDTPLYWAWQGWVAGRKAECERCAKVCDDLDDDVPDGLAGWQYGEAIRARGQG